MSIANLCGSLQSEEADLRSAQVAAKRPIFHAELGAMLIELRTRKGLSVQEAVNFSKAKHPKALTWNRLTRLESGKTKHPDAEALKALADIYGLDYAELASRYITANYGRDLLRHGGTGQIDSHLAKGESDGPAQTRIRELEDRLAAHEAIFKRLRTELATAVALLGEEGNQATGTTARRRGRHRKAG